MLSSVYYFGHVQTFCFSLGVAAHPGETSSVQNLRFFSSRAKVAIPGEKQPGIRIKSLSEFLLGEGMSICILF